MFVNEAQYLKLHTELTLLAYLQVGTTAEAKDLASRALIQWWLALQGGKTLTLDKTHLIRFLQKFCRMAQQHNAKRYKAEQQFCQTRSSHPSVASAFRVEERKQVYWLSQQLPWGEQAVLCAMLLDELDPESISVQMGKPISTVHLLRDRAVYLIKKLRAKP